MVWCYSCENAYCAHGSALICAVALDDQWVQLLRMPLIVVTEIVAPLLSKEEKEEESSDVRTESRDVSTEDVLQQSTSESKEISTSENKEISTSESKEISAAEIEQASTSETERPDAGTLTLPSAPGVAEGFQIPVVVVESREDRLCFPFLWRRSTKYSQVHPGITSTKSFDSLLIE